VGCIRLHTIKGGRIDGMSISKFVEVNEESLLYLLDIDSYLGREMNFKIYDELSGIFELWIDAAPRRHYDVMDILVSGGNMAIIMDHFMKPREIEKSVEITENIILKSFSFEIIEKFIMVGGKKVITSPNIASLLSGEIYVLKGGEICPWKN